MPELPEVETTRRGIRPFLEGQRVREVVVRDRRLRWPVPRSLDRQLRGQIVAEVGRRAKYLLLRTEQGSAIVHLGMSGSLRIVAPDSPVRKHDHVDFVIDNHKVLRFHDPRRFGSIHWTRRDPLQHPLLKSLGPEPLSADFSGATLFARSRRRTAAVKAFIMDSRIVVGVGNIYASEALFRAGINPRRQAGRISARRFAQLATVIKEVLSESIAAGGTTLRDFVNSEGNPGSYRIRLDVYDNAGAPCPKCGTAIRLIRLGQRSTYYCTGCQR